MSEDDHMDHAFGTGLAPFAAGNTQFSEKGKKSEYAPSGNVAYSTKKQVNQSK